MKEMLGTSAWGSREFLVNDPANGVIKRRKRQNSRETKMGINKHGDGFLPLRGEAVNELAPNLL